MRSSLFHASFRPRLIDALKDYNRARFAGDVGAGLTVGVVALPLAMAFAVASGATPQAGIFTAIIAGFLISALGGSRVQIGGPAGAFIVIIYGIIDRYGFANLLISTVLAGGLLFAMGLFRLGSLIRYIPVAIVIGFTNGIAVLVALSQVKDFLGLDIGKAPADFFGQAHAIIDHLHTVDMPTVALGIASLAAVFVWPKLWQRRPAPFPVNVQETGFVPSRALRIFGAVPGTIVVLIAGAVAVSLLNLPVDTIGSRFGGIPTGLPSFQLPTFSWDLVKQLFAPTLTIALLGAVESLLCARIADSMISDRHDPNQELMAQGIANVVTPFFGGLPATGTIARTMTNVRSGASSPIAGIVHALTLLAIVLLAAPLAATIPLVSLAAILLYVAFNMGEWHEFARLGRFTLSYRVLLIATFLLTVIVDLTVAVEVGLVLACVFFIVRIANLTHIEPIERGVLPGSLPEGTAAYSVFGSLFFGAVGKMEALIDPDAIPPKALILEMHQLINMDATALDTLDTIRKTLEKKGSQLILCVPDRQPLDLMRRTGFLDRLQPENVKLTLAEAVTRAHEIAAQPREK